MNMLSILFGLLFLVSPPAQNEGLKYLDNAIARFKGIKDYVVDVKVHLDLEAVKAPDMEARVYFKEPDKVKIDSKGLFFMPREVGVINPRKFNPDKYVIQVLDTLTYEGEPAVRLSLTPKKDESGNHDIVLTIDEKDWLIREIGTAPSPGRTASAKITYGEFDGFMMPVKVDVKLDIGKVNTQGREFEGRRMQMNQMKGTVEVYYSNYKINTGLSDKIFEKREEQ